jgi:hypothetical protein
MIAAELVEVDALWHVLVYSLVGTLGLVIAFGGVLIAVDRGAREDGPGPARTTWMAAAAIAGLVCVAILVLGIWAMTQKS